MLKRKKIVRILAALVLVVLLWVVFLVVQGLFERKVSHHEQYIPENAESVLEIKSEALIRAFIEDILTEGELDDRINGYVTSSDDQSKGDGESLGMDFFANCYIFTLQKDASPITGILINVLDDEQFNESMGSTKSSGTGYAVRNGVGLMLFDSANDPKSAQELNAIAQKMIKDPTKFDLNLLKPTVEDPQANYWAKEYVFNEKKTFKELHLSLAVTGNQLSIKGDANFQSKESKNYPILKPNDLSIQTQFIPNKVNELWMNNMQNLGFAFPKLTYISGNYHYSEPSPIKEMKVLPNFDGVYAFDENFKIRIPLIGLAASRKINSLNLDSFKIGKKKIYYKQIDDKTIYLGQSKYNPAPNQKNALFEINGDLKQLLEIRNGGITQRFLKFSPEYNAAERFLSNIQKSNFYIKDSDSKKVDVLGEITFTDGKSALNETTVLLMNLGYFE